MLETQTSSSIGDTQLFKSSRIRDKITDCESLGLEYWSDQTTGRVWATSPDRQFHSVNIVSKRNPVASHDTGTCCLESWSAENIKASR